MLDLPPKFDKLGLSFSHSKQGLAPKAPKVPSVLTLVKFTSVGFSILVRPMLLVMMLAMITTLIT